MRTGPSLVSKQVWSVPPGWPGRAALSSAPCWREQDHAQQVQRWMHCCGAKTHLGKIIRVGPLCFPQATPRALLPELTGEKVGKKRCGAALSFFNIPHVSIFTSFRKSALIGQIVSYLLLPLGLLVVHPLDSLFTLDASSLYSEISFFCGQALLYTTCV